MSRDGNRDDGAGLVPLSGRETQVLSLASRGLTNEQIARSLDVTIHAVKFHLGSIYKKLGVRNRTEATAHYVHVAAMSSVTSADGLTR